MPVRRGRRERIPERPPEINLASQLELIEQDKQRCMKINFWLDIGYFLMYVGLAIAMSNGFSDLEISIIGAFSVFIILGKLFLVIFGFVKTQDASWNAIGLICGIRIALLIPLVVVTVSISNVSGEKQDSYVASISKVIVFAHFTQAIAPTLRFYALRQDQMEYELQVVERKKQFEKRCQ